MAKPFLAGALAALLLAFGLLASGPSLLHSIHHHDAADANGCVICSLAHGQIALPDAAPPAVATVFGPLYGLLAASAGVPWSFHFLLPPGRAPPRFSHRS